MKVSFANPPRAAERLLMSLGADSEFADEVIGDLAEEFALRVRWDGVPAARRWYYGEGFRVAPYLLRDWWRERVRADAVHVMTAVVVASLVTWVVEKVAARNLDPVVVAWWRVVGQSPVYFGSMLSWTLLDGLLCGYLAARIGRRAPVVSTLVAAAWWAAFGFGVSLVGGWMFAGSMGQMWYRAINPLVLGGGILIGGLWRAARSGRRTAISELPGN